MNTKYKYENKGINSIKFKKLIWIAGWIVGSLTEIGNNKRKDSSSLFWYRGEVTENLCFGGINLQIPGRIGITFYKHWNKHICCWRDIQDKDTYFGFKYIVKKLY